MKNKDLHNTISALDLPAVETPALQARLKRDVLSYDAKQRSLSKRFRAAFQNIKGASMSHKKTFFGAGSLAIAAAVVIGITGYNYQHSPRAQAEQLVNHGLFQITQISDAQFGSIQEKIGGNPKDALKEAKEAKDLKVITKAEFDAESAAAETVLSSSLDSGDGNQPSTMSIKGKTATGTTGGKATAGTFSTQTLAAGGSVNATSTSSGTVTVVNGSMTPGTAANSSTEGQPPTVTFMPVENGTTTAVPANGETAMPLIATGGEPAPGQGEGASFTVSSGTTAMATATPVGKMNPANFTVVMPTSYLRYTDAKGQVVVLSLDKDGLPMFKTIFLSSKK